MLFAAVRAPRGPGFVLGLVGFLTLVELALAALSAPWIAREIGPLFWLYLGVVGSSEVGAVVLLLRRRRVGLYLFTLAHTVDAAFTVFTWDAHLLTLSVSCGLVALAWTQWSRLLPARP